MMLMMKAILLCFVVSFLHVLVSLVGVSSRTLEPHHGPFVKEQATIPNLNSLQMTWSSNEGMKNKLESSENKEINQIGSSPPSCEHKCYGCSPCVAIQVPTTTGHVGLHYTNYEPEGWKCKCGPIFFSP